MGTHPGPDAEDAVLNGLDAEAVVAGHEGGSGLLEQPFGLLGADDEEEEAHSANHSVCSLGSRRIGISHRARL
eukprot:7484445-Alexandrium_andersonii.AAC.1